MSQYIVTLFPQVMNLQKFDRMTICYMGDNLPFQKEVETLGRS